MEDFTLLRWHSGTQKRVERAKRVQIDNEARLPWKSIVKTKHQSLTNPAFMQLVPGADRVVRHICIRCMRGLSCLTAAAIHVLQLCTVTTSLDACAIWRCRSPWGAVGLGECCTSWLQDLAWSPTHQSQFKVDQEQEEGQ